MDEIWYENPSKSEVIGPCGGDGKKQMTTQNRQKIAGIQTQIMMVNFSKYIIM